MSVREEQVRALERAHEFLLDLGSTRKILPVSELRAEARDIVKHFPYPGEIETYWSKQDPVDRSDDPPCSGPGYSHKPHGNCPGYSYDRT